LAEVTLQNVSKVYSEDVVAVRELRIQKRSFKSSLRNRGGGGCVGYVPSIT